MTGARDALRALANPDRVPALSRFFKTGPGEYAEGDRFLGATVPQVRSLARRFSGIPLDEVTDLLQSPVHEERLLALLILVRRYQQGDSTTQACVYRIYTRNFKWINNWDLIDVTAEHVIGAHLFARDRTVLYPWARANMVWPRRIAIMSTFYFIKRNDHGETLRLAECLLHDPHDLIHKAVGWMLREIGNRDHDTEVAFLEKHAAVMPRTMLRYAIEKFSEPERKHYMTRKR